MANPTLFNRAVRDIVWDEMKNGRTGLELVASMPERTGNLKRSYRVTRPNSRTVRVSFPGADYLVLPVIRVRFNEKNQRLAAAVFDAERLAVRRRQSDIAQAVFMFLGAHFAREFSQASDPNFFFSINRQLRVAGRTVNLTR